MEQIAVDAGGLRVAALADGPADGPLAVCLHGFPDTAHTWRHLLPALAARGYRAVAPWLRGYAPTGPAPDGRYGLDSLAADANALHEALGGDARAVLIGHDWGAAAVYDALLSAPERWSRAVAIAVPATDAGIDLSTEDQMRRSWYSFFLQLPDLAVVEETVAADDMRLIERLWEDWSPGYDHTTDMAHVREALAPPECLRAAITYYRHNASRVHHPGHIEQAREAMGAVRAPLLYLHGADDGCLGSQLLQPSLTAFPPDTRIEVVPAAGHFVQLERPDAVARLVGGFLDGTG